jgi:glycosyltransferase involved in cell wall biosynthesis
VKIAYIAAGAAGMYCGSCLHDNTLAAALQSAGHEVALLPTYTPLRTDEPDVSLGRVFYGALNVYLQQKSALFRHTPAALDRLLDRPALLGQVGRLAGATDAHELGALTLSVLRGEDGRQAKELAKLIDWLGEFRPELVQLTNALFLGMAAPIRRALGVPVVCGLTGEDLFLDELEEPWHGEVLAELRRRAGDADGFLAPSTDYAGRMAEILGIAPERIHVVPLGINLDGYGDAAGRGGARADGGETGDAGAAPGADGEDEDGEARAAAAGASIAVPGAGAGRWTDGGPAPFTVGYLARQCPEKGLHLLVEAFELLAADWPSDRPPPRLAVAGWIGPRDRAWVEGLRGELAAAGLGEHAEMRGEVDRAGKLALLARLDVLSVPTVYRESKGLFVLEALAAGVPVVEPDHGAFPELIETTGGGLLVEPGSPPALAAALRRLADDPALARELGRRGRAAVAERHGAAAMAEATVDVYRRLLAAR